MEVKKDGGGQWSCAGASSAPSSPACHRSILLASLLIFLIIGVCVGLLVGGYIHKNIKITTQPNTLFYYILYRCNV